MANEKKNNKGLLIVIILLVVIVVAGLGVAAGYFIINKSNKTTAASINTNSQLSSNATTQVSKLTFALDEFLINLSDEGGKRYIKVKIYIGYDNKKLTSELELKKPIIRDAVNSALRSKKTTDFTEKGTEDIKKELLNRINPILTSGKTDNLYFYDILTQ